ncbi:MAG: redoxin domain-containing protein [Candidatus Binatia bacterium]
MRLPRNHAAVLGLLLGLASFLGYALVVVPTLSPHWPVLRDRPVLNLLLVAAGLAFSIVGVWRAVGRRPTHRGRRLAPLLAGLNIAVAGTFLWLLYVHSAHLPPSSRAPAVGSMAPDFALTDQHGQPIQLASLRGKPVVLVFYRGFW